MVNPGKISQIIGPVVDVRFEGEMPPVYQKLVISETQTVLEVLSHISQGVVRCISMTATDGLSRGMQAHTVEVHTWSKDSVSVDFDIIYPGEIEPMKTSLTVVRNPDSDVWSVVYAQERM